MTILFRSRTLDHTHTGSSMRSIKSRGSDWINLRMYDNDDTRDIVWSRSTSDKLFVKDRINSGAMKIVCITISGTGDDFYITHSSESKSDFLKKCSIKISRSAQENRYNYSQYATHNLETISKELLLNRTEDHLILVFHSFDRISYALESIQKLAQVNDIIIFDVLHPFEKNPDNTTLIEGGIVSESSRNKYVQTLKDITNKRKQTLQKHNIAYGFLDTSEEVEDYLNYFFKTRILHGY